MKVCYHMHISMLFLNFHAGLICEEYTSLAFFFFFLKTDPNPFLHSCRDQPFFIGHLYIKSMPICMLCRNYSGVNNRNKGFILIVGDHIMRSYL